MPGPQRGNGVNEVSEIGRVKGREHILTRARRLPTPATPTPGLPAIGSSEPGSGAGGLAGSHLSATKAHDAHGTLPVGPATWLPDGSRGTVFC